MAKTKSIKQLEKEIASVKSEVDKVLLLNQLAMLVKHSDATRAIRLTSEALSIAERLDFQEGIADSSQKLAAFYNTLIGDISQAKLYAERALYLYRLIEDSRGEIVTLQTLGRIYTDLLDFTSAERCFSESLELSTIYGIDVGSNYSCLGDLYHESGRYDEAIENFQKALSIRRSESNKEREAIILNNLGNIYDDIGQYAVALQHHTLSMTIKTEMNDQYGISASLNNIASIYVKFGDFENALIYLYKSLAIKETQNNQIGSANTLINIGSILLELHRYEEASLILTNAQKIYSQLQQPQKVALALNHIGIVQLKLGNSEQGLQSLLESYHLRKEMNDIHGLASSCYNLAQSYNNLRDYPNAILFAERGLDFNKSIGEQRRLPEHYVGLAEIYFNDQQIIPAIEAARNSIHLSLEQGDKPKLYRAYNVLAQALERSGDIQNALDNYKSFLEIKEQVLNENITHKMQTLFIQFDVERTRKASEINLLKAQQLEQELEMKKKELSLMALHLVNKNEFLNEIKEQISSDITTTSTFIKELSRRIQNGIESEKDWEMFEQQFVRVNPEFTAKLMEASKHKLTPTEIKICTLLKTGLTTKDIANVLFLSGRTVENHRYNINRKLGLGNGKLSAFLMTF